MSIYIKKDVWQKRIKGWIITDCAVRDKNIIYLCLRKDIPHEKASMMFDHDIHSKISAIYLDTPDEPYGGQELDGFNKPRVGVSLKPAAQGLIVARNSRGDVWTVGGGYDGAMEHIHPDGWPLTWRIKCINGHAYSVGGQRKIYKRIDIGKWVPVTNLPKAEAIETVGFRDLDAFSESDMYAVGGHGDVWHFDGKAWKQMGFPSNVQLGTVTCAGDGNVYISGEGGSLWVGRESTWKRIYKGGSSILWNDVLWFQDKLWLASDYQFRIWNGHEMQPVPGAIIAGHMDARDGLLAIASPTQVMAYDGKNWRTIVSPYSDQEEVSNAESCTFFQMQDQVQMTKDNS